MAVPVNATGWTKLIDGQIIGAVFTMFDTALMGWTIAILFIVYQAVLYLKARNATLCWVTGLFFISMYVTSVYFQDNPSISVPIIFLILVFELAGILYSVVFKG